MTDPSPQTSQLVYQKISELLAEHGCTIQPVLHAEPVGGDPGRALLSARWGVVQLNPQADATENPAD